MMLSILQLPLILLSHTYRLLGWELIWSLYTSEQLEELDKYLEQERLKDE